MQHSLLNINAQLTIHYYGNTCRPPGGHRVQELASVSLIWLHQGDIFFYSFPGKYVKYDAQNDIELPQGGLQTVKGTQQECEMDGSGQTQIKQWAYAAFTGRRVSGIRCTRNASEPTRREVMREKRTLVRIYNVE